MALPHEPVASDPWQARVSVAQHAYAVYTGVADHQVDWDGMDSAIQAAMALDTGSEATLPGPVNADLSAADHQTLRALPVDVLVGMLMAYREEARCGRVPAPIMSMPSSPQVPITSAPHPGSEAAGLDPGDAQMTPEQALRDLEAREAAAPPPVPPTPSDAERALIAFERDQSPAVPPTAPHDPVDHPNVRRM